MFRFEHPIFLNLLMLLPLMVVLYWLYNRWKSKVASSFGDSQVVSRLMLDVSPFRMHLKFALILITTAAVLLALANPQIGSKLEKAQRKGVDIVIALDVSNSMLAQDIQPSRIERARQSISRLIDELENDRIGLVVFAGKAYTQLPITTDYAAAKMMLSTVGPGMVPVQGTAIGQAIDLASVSFKNEKSGKAIVIITDGENHDDDAIEKASEAAKAGIRVYTIGMGLAEGGPIPVYKDGEITGFKKDKAGSTIITRLDETMLNKIAEAGNGIYVRASNTQAGLRKVFEEISKLEKVTVDTKSFSDYEDRFQYFVAIALLAIVINFLLNERQSKWARKISLFHPGKNIKK
ncbi:MAG: VWA domain-containing protein [Lentimicrobium sp.]|nr:VWA domain-containing protein [Lentimicrobium sp.]